MYQRPVSGLSPLFEVHKPAYYWHMSSAGRVPWRTLSSRIAYSNPWFGVREDKVVRPDGVEGVYNVVETKAPAVFIVPLTEQNQIYLVRLFRYPTQDFSWELPAGNSDGEQPELAARRELLEETGLVADQWETVGTFNAMNGICSERSYVLIARQLHQTQQDSQLEEGISEVQAFPFGEVFDMVRSGAMHDGQSIAAVTKAALHLGLLHFS